jgi:pyruvate dehydrogenase E2 component (dihydrolipoamide acetyltransferase)
MKVDVLMPEMGESITEGTVAKWLKEPGDKVERDEAILEITTDKIDSEIPSPEDGVLAEILAEEGKTVAVGDALARIETEEAAAEAHEKAEPSEPAAEEKAPEKEQPAPEKAPPAPRKPAAQEAPQPKVDRPLSPVARSLVREEGLTEEELDSIEGSGRGGRVTKDDVVKYLESRTPAAPETRPEPKAPKPSREGLFEVIEMTQMRKSIAEHMVRSKHTSAHTYTVAEVDMTRIVRFRDSVKEAFQRENGFKLTFTPFILHAAVRALKAHPLMNSSLDGDRILQWEYVNLGVAVAIESGLIVPVIKQADEKNLLGLARAANDLAIRAHNKKLVPDDVQGGTFTVTNPGIFGNIFGFPIINQPQVGILGVGAIKRRPVVIDDAIAIRSIMYVSLSYDHRVVDGAVAARFLQEIRGILEDYDIDRAL